MDTERRKDLHRQRAAWASFFSLSARTDPDSVDPREGTTVFLVPLGTPGFRIGKIFNKSGWRFYQNAELIFEDARVPHANVVGHG